MRVRIFADDLSGAADCAASFTGSCGPIPLILEGQTPAGSFACDTDSRALDAGEATVRWRALGALAAPVEPDDILYKKVDSTLRGHIVAETEAFLAARPDIERAIFTPAFPAQGRTFTGGTLYVRGIARAKAPRFSDARVQVLEAVTAEDLAYIAAEGRAAARRTLWIGSAGLARALAGTAPRSVAAATLPSPKLIAVGSFADVTRAQVTAWRERHPETVLAVGDAARAGDVMRTHGFALVHIPEPSRELGRALVQELARVLRKTAAQAGTLVLTGGDTARAMLDALALTPRVEGELEPGISVCTTAGPHLVIKAGGFGDNGVFLRLR